MHSTLGRSTLIPLALMVVGMLGACSYGWARLAAPVTVESTPAIITTPPPPPAFQLLSTLERAEVPLRDLAALARRLRKVESVPSVAADAPNPGEVGDEERFWVANTDTNEEQEVTAVLQLITPHLYVWVEKGVEVDLQALQQSAGRFESQTYPANHRYFGTEWNPGVDGDPRLSILHARGLGDSVAGYFLSSDEFSRQAHPYSNEREMLYANLDRVEVGSDFYDGMLAHEFQHMIHWHMDRNEELWLNEGLAVLASNLNGFEYGPVVQAFLAQPDTQLTDLSYESSGQAHYGAAFLFALYFWERFGDGATRALVAHPAGGLDGIDAILRQMGANVDSEGLFADWVAALYLDRPDLGVGQYGFRALDPPQPVPAAQYDQFPVGRTEAVVRQFGTDYIHLSGNSPVTVLFTGTQQVRLLDTDAHGGDAFWWSNQGDEIDTTLTRAFDLSGLEAATLDYWLWYDTEEGWDYAYLEISTDGGRTWDTLPALHTTGDDPTGNNFGHGYTGTSGGSAAADWIREQADLSAYAGLPVLIRFEYITDGAVTGSGVALGDLAIPQLDYHDGFEADDPAWETAGFVRCGNVLPQQYLIQLIELDAQPRIQRLALDPQGSAQWTIPLRAEMQVAVLAVSGATPVTRQPASYAYQIAIQ